MTPALYESSFSQGIGVSQGIVHESFLEIACGEVRISPKTTSSSLPISDEVSNTLPILTYPCNPSQSRANVTPSKREIMMGT